MGAEPIKIKPKIYAVFGLLAIGLGALLVHFAKTKVWHGAK